MRIQSRDRYAIVADFLPETGELVEVLREEAGALLEEPLGGHFSWSLGPLSVLYRDKGSLRLRVGKADGLLSEVDVDWSVDGEQVRLILSMPGGGDPYVLVPQGGGICLRFYGLRRTGGL